MEKLKLDLSKNNVICGDCKDWLPYIPDNSIDLVYIDPPFFSNKNYEIIWGNGYELRSYEDRWKGGIRHYIEWMRERLLIAHKKIKETGSFLLHCDWHASHHLRLLLDEIFDEKNFINEIIWSYFKPHAGEKSFPKNHHNIYWYSKEKDKQTFNKEFSLAPYDDKAKKRYNKIDKNGDRYKVYNDKKEGTKRKAYLKKGKPVDIFKIPFVQGNAKEKVGYDTQKPEALIKKFIQACSNEGDIVLDFFGGGGTTAKVAFDLERRFITGDVSPVAVRVIKETRLKMAGCDNFIDCNPKLTKEEWNGVKGHYFAKKICEYMGWEVNPKKSGDGGIDGWVNGKRKRPVQIKNSKIGEQVIRDFVGACSAKGHKNGIIVGWGFSKKCYDFRAKIAQNKGIKVELKEAETIIKPIGSMKKREWEKLYRERVKESKRWPSAA